jgi:hypothetical protein
MNTLILLVAVGIGNPPAGPLHCAAPTASRGEVKAGRPLSHTFELTHRGTGTLTITKVGAGCGCLRQSLTGAVLTSGQSAKLTLEVNTLTQPDGPNRWQAVVGYAVDSPGAPKQTGELLLQITATLSREVSVSPPQVGFSTAGAASQVVTVTDSRARPLTVLKATTTSPRLTAEVGLREAGKGQAVTIKLSADVPAGQYDESVVLYSDDPEYPELRVPVRVSKRAPGSVVASPESVTLRFAEGQGELSALVQLRGANGLAVEVQSAEGDTPAVAVKASTGRCAAAVVRVTIPASAADQPGACKVRVKFAEPAGAELVIPVAWTRAKK